jgi:hypothetical protein
MEFVNRHWGPSAQDEHQTMRIAGATFVHHPVADAYHYAHSFLREALESTPPGSWRDLALLREMEIGFDFSGTCEAGDFPFERVIAMGEPLIGRNGDPEVLATARFMVADAYATIVALASGAGGDHADPAPHRDRARVAREKAIAHYRAGLALDRSSDRARSAWATAWRLMAGLAPSDATYLCVHD